VNVDGESVERALFNTTTRSSDVQRSATLLYQQHKPIAHHSPSPFQRCSLYSVPSPLRAIHTPAFLGSSLPIIPCTGRRFFKVVRGMLVFRSLFIRDATHLAIGCPQALCKLRRSCASWHPPLRQSFRQV
jgi:hypothetical protein